MTGRAEVEFYPTSEYHEVSFFRAFVWTCSNESALEAGKRGIIVGGWAELSEEPRSELCDGQMVEIYQHSRMLLSFPQSHQNMPCFLSSLGGDDVEDLKAS